MQTFKDREGMDWKIDVDLNSVRQVRKSVDVDLLTLYGDPEKGTEGLFDKLQDPIALVDTLQVLCSEQAEAAGIDGKAFAGRLNGDALEEATNTLLEALCDFFPRSRAKIIRQLLQKSKAAGVLQTDQAMVKLEAITPESLAGLPEPEEDDEDAKAGETSSSS